MPSFTLQLLGGVILEQDGQRVELDTRKALGLLAYLLITGRAHSRDTLSAQFWPNYDQVSARGALRRTLSSLRKAIGTAMLDTSRELVALSTEAILVCDAIRFRRNLKQVEMHVPAHLAAQREPCPECLEKLTTAANLYQGDFMAGFSLRDSFLFDEWQFQEAEQFRREFASVLFRLSEANISRLDFETALNFSRRWLALDHLNEAAHRQLMQLYAWSGHREAALRQYRECVRILEEELGVAPLDETLRVYEDISLNRLSPPPGSPIEAAHDVTLSVPPPKILGDQADQVEPSRQLTLLNRLPLVGRETELQHLEKIYQGITNDGFVVGLVGEPGVGKTRLADEFLGQVLAWGGRILRGRSYEGEQDLAFASITAALRGGLQPEDLVGRLEKVPSFALAETIRLVPELVPQQGRPTAVGYSFLPPGDAPQFVEGPGAQTRFFEGVCQVLLALVTDQTQEAPGVIFLDDLHWADHASLDVLAYLTRRLTGRRVMVLCSWQPAQLDRPQRLHTMLAGQTREGRGAQILLNRLSDSEVGRLIRAAEGIGGPLSDTWRAHLSHAAEGNPFFLVAYLSAFYQNEFGPEFSDAVLPASVQEMLHTRLEKLDPASHQAIQSAAVIGHSFDLEMLQETSGRSEEEAIFALEALLARGLITEINPGESEPSASPRYDFSHDQMRILVCSELSLARFRLLHRRAAESLESHASRRDPNLAAQLAAQIAAHYRQAGETTKSAGFYCRAGEYARRLYANHDALQYFETALAFGHPDRSFLHLEIGDLHVLQGDYQAAINSFQAAASLSSAERLAQAERKIGLVYDRMGEWSRAIEQFHAALVYLADEATELRAEILSECSLSCHRRGDQGEASRLSERALEQANLSAEPSALAQVHNLLGVLARSRGEMDHAREHLEQSYDLAEKIGNLSFQVAALNNLALVNQEAGEIQAARGLVERALQLCLAIGDRHREAALRNHLADLFRAEGNIQAAIDQLILAVPIFTEISQDSGEWQPEIWKLVEW